MNIFLNNINTLLDNNAPHKKVNKYMLKFNSKPWITSSLQKSILLLSRIDKQTNLAST